MKQYAIFGMSFLCKWLINEIGDSKVCYIIDNNESLWGSCWKGIPIISLDDYVSKGEEYEIIIASNRYYEEIKAQLVNKKIANIVSVSKVWGMQKLERKKETQIFLMNAHSYTNGGDYFITLAEKKYISENFGCHELVLIPSAVCSHDVDDLKEYIKEKDLILITGGGYLGNLWLENGEFNVREIIKAFSNNRIIIMPQSMYFTADQSGSEQKEKTSMIYQGHKKLTVCLREMQSFGMAKSLLRQDQILLVPDITFLYPLEVGENRKGIAYCFRDDKEACLTSKERVDLKNILNMKSEALDSFEMEVGELLSENEAEQEVLSKLEKIAEYRLVITDRLHCMMMCMVTGTPCIAFDNLSGKVSGTYELIGPIPHIRILKEKENLQKEINDLLCREIEIKRNDEEVRNYYRDLTKMISDAIGGV